jgi:hypothetical protein
MKIALSVISSSRRAASFQSVANNTAAAGAYLAGSKCLLRSGSMTKRAAKKYFCVMPERKTVNQS